MIFEIVGVVPGREITAVGRPGPTRRFGPMACTYCVTPQGQRSRLIGRLDLRAPAWGMEGRRRRPGWVGPATPIAWGDLVMMRKQLRTLAACAERSA